MRPKTISPRIQNLLNISNELLDAGRLKNPSYTQLESAIIPVLPPPPRYTSFSSSHHQYSLSYVNAFTSFTQHTVTEKNEKNAD